MDIYATLNYLLLNSEVEVVVSVSVAQNCCKELVDNKLTRFPEPNFDLLELFHPSTRLHGYLVAHVAIKRLGDSFGNCLKRWGNLWWSFVPKMPRINQ